MSLVSLCRCLVVSLALCRFVSSGLFGLFGLLTWFVCEHGHIEWTRIFQSSGAQYVLPVAKHHDGFCMWNCSATAPGWNAVDTGPKRDVLTELYDAVTATDNMSFGIYFSQVQCFVSSLFRWLIVRLAGWLIALSVDWSIDRLVDWSIG